MTAGHVTTILVTRTVIGCPMPARKGGVPGYENTQVITNKTFRVLMLESVHPFQLAIHLGC